MDSSKIVSALNHPFIRNMDTEYTKLAANLASKHSFILSANSTHSSKQVSNEDDEAGALL